MNWLGHVVATGAITPKNHRRRSRGAGGHVPHKIWEKYFLGNYCVKCGHFSGKNHVKFANFVNFFGKILYKFRYFANFSGKK